mmetsp:Transcript_99792/g.197991  ORF Transcript_99792/g.197991 Transcript_99792/m.197991 type:complete len:94 (-) Transcript_99792:1563-1844(-)
MAAQETLVPFDGLPDGDGDDFCRDGMAATAVLVVRGDAGADDVPRPLAAGIPAPFAHCKPTKLSEGAAPRRPVCCVVWGMDVGMTPETGVTCR